MYTPPDYYLVDELLSDEHKLVRSAVREWVDKSVIPIIDDAAQNHTFPIHLIKEMGEIGAFGPYIPEKYGGAGMDQVDWKEVIPQSDQQLLYKHH